MLKILEIVIGVAVIVAVLFSTFHIGRLYGYHKSPKQGACMSVLYEHTQQQQPQKGKEP